MLVSALITPCSRPVHFFWKFVFPFLVEISARCSTCLAVLAEWDPGSSSSGGSSATCSAFGHFSPAVFSSVGAEVFDLPLPLVRSD